MRCPLVTGGGAREKVFWHNYFFHCAYTRYEAGLSIDEIWSFPSSDEAQAATATAGADETAGVAGDEGAEETVVFDETAVSGDSKEGEPGTTSETVFAPDSALDGTGLDPATAVEPVVDGTGSPDTADFELVGDSDVGGVVDAELDELEAEIARELED